MGKNPLQMNLAKHQEGIQIMLAVGSSQSRYSNHHPIGGTRYSAIYLVKLLLQPTLPSFPSCNNFTLPSNIQKKKPSSAVKLTPGMA